MNLFFESSRFAVVGASKDPFKFGNKVLKWYSARNIPVTPIHPKEPEIESIPTVANVCDLLQKLQKDDQIKDANQVALSIVTPPKISLAVVKEALGELGIVAVWLQPEAEDAGFVDWVKSQPKDVQVRVVYDGPCILVSGDELARAKGKL